MSDVKNAVCHTHSGQGSAEWLDLLARVGEGLMVRADSRTVQPGEAFVALPSSGREAVRDGASFVSDALSRGAAVVVVESSAVLPEAVSAGARIVRVEDARAALGELAAAYFKTRERAAPLIGVTGTNGKTTVTYLLERLFTAAGRKVGVIGTVSYRWPGFFQDASRTTPDCWSLHQLLAGMDEAGADAAFMEVSSHALEQGRVAGLEFAAAVWTNLTQDHLDYHGDMASYFEAKASLFVGCPSETKKSIINSDDPWGRKLISRLRDLGRPVLAYGLDDVSAHPELAGLRPSDVLRGEILSMTGKGLELALAFGGERLILRSPLVGRHNAQNLLAACGCALSLGLPAEALASLGDYSGAAGRLERVQNERGLDIFVDYAHTPDALENVLRALKALDFGRVLTVFGCGGDRDRTKRPLMGRAVAALSDVAILTSDNPRTEDPRAIITDVLPGLAGCPDVVVEPDRREALRLALAGMRPGDALLVAGKGHETYQIVGAEKLPFSDAAVIRELLGEASPCA